MTAIQYDGHVIKFTEYKDKKKSKSKELDFIKQLDQIIEQYRFSCLILSLVIGTPSGTRTSYTYKDTIQSFGLLP